MNKSLLFWMKNEIESVQYVRKSLLVWSEHENPKNEAMQYLVTRSDYYKLNPSNRSIESERIANIFTNCWWPPLSFFLVFVCALLRRASFVNSRTMPWLISHTFILRPINITRTAFDSTFWAAPGKGISQAHLKTYIRTSLQKKIICDCEEIRKPTFLCFYYYSFFFFFHLLFMFDYVVI